MKNTLKKENGKYYANGVEYKTFREAIESIWKRK